MSFIDRKNSLRWAAGNRYRKPLLTFGGAQLAVGILGWMFPTLSDTELYDIVENPFLHLEKWASGSCGDIAGDTLRTVCGC